MVYIKFIFKQKWAVFLINTICSCVFLKKGHSYKNVLLYIKNKRVNNFYTNSFIHALFCNILRTYKKKS